MKSRSYFSSVGLILLLLAAFFVAACPQPKINPEQQVRPKISGDGPVLAFTDKSIEFICGDAITKEVILEKLKDETYLKVESENEEHSGDFVFEVSDFTIPAHTHGFFEISFSVADSTGKKTECTFAIRIKENLTPGTVTLIYDGSTALKFPLGTDPKLNLTALLRKEGTGLSVTNTNACADARGYEMIEETLPADVGGQKYYLVLGTYHGVKFKVKDWLGVESQEVEVSIEIIQPDSPPTVIPPDAPLSVNYMSIVSDGALYEHLKTGQIVSIDVSVDWTTSTLNRITVVDTSKNGIQRIYCRVTDKHGNKSEKFFIRVNVSGGPDPENILQDPSFEEEPAPLAGTVTKDRYKAARLSSHWEIVPTTISIRGNNYEGGTVENQKLKKVSISCSGNEADYAQGPIVLNEAYYLALPNCSANGDNGYALLSGKANMADLVAVGGLDHMLVYRATEKKSDGNYSLALRGKYYRPFHYNSAFWNFWGVGCALRQEVTLEPGHTYQAKAKIIKSFGRNENSSLIDGMVGAIYISVKRKTAPQTDLIKLHIEGHPPIAQNGNFIPFETGTFSVTEPTTAIFEIRRYLSNDADGENEESSTWGYSPIYIDDCQLMDTPIPPVHIPEEEQLPPSEG